MDINKLGDYSLNLEHRRGRHKAQVFAAALDLSQADAEFLRTDFQKLEHVGVFEDASGGGVHLSHRWRDFCRRQHGPPEQATQPPGTGYSAWIVLSVRMRQFHQTYRSNEVVEYALSRTLSPALIAEYQTKLPDKKILQAKLQKFYLQNASD